MEEGHGILSINGGSSSIKFSLYRARDPLERSPYGAIENIGTKNAKLNFNTATDQEKNSFDIEAEDYDQAADHLIDWLEKQDHFTSVSAIGHRIVHGTEHTEPELITENLLIELKKIGDFDPEHLPEEIKLIEVFKKRRPRKEQIACFDIRRLEVNLSAEYSFKERINDKYCFLKGSLESS